MTITDLELCNHLDEYLDWAASEDIIITKDGVPIARLVGMEPKSFRTNRLIGILPSDIDENAMKEERRQRQ